jgi:3'(2'), 5'-bisphosphate nucleotidase
MMEIAREAATIIERVYATDFVVEYKGPRDPVTQADREANALICSRLIDQFPGVPIVAEESDAASFGDFWNAERTFFVDPLDGTLEFVAKNGDFAFMIGLAERGRAIAGVVVAPASGMAWVGAPGVGAWLVGRSGNKTELHVSATADLSDATLMVSRSQKKESLDRLLAAVRPRQVVARGGAGLKAAAVAQGEADLYVQPGRAGQRWDACAPDAIVRAAGGRFTDTFGDDIDYGCQSLVNDRGFVVSNAILHERVLELFRGA